jgi:hypothetical protein
MSDCTAVGSYVPRPSTTIGEFGAPLAEHWNGSSWQRESVPMAADAVSEGLGAISCWGPVLCGAVGSYTDSKGAGLPLVLLWNGTRWTIQTLLVPSGGSSPSLSGVSCNSASACIAVGSYTDQAGETVPLAETWNGRTWAAESPPSPAGSIGSGLSAISCPSVRTCTAVGGTSTNTTGTSFAELLEAGRWTIQSTPTPRGGSYLGLDSVSCTSADECAAAGFYSNAAGNTVAVAERSSRSGWRAYRVPEPAGGGFLLGVSCPSATSCTAAGLGYPASGGNSTMADTWDGMVWTAAVTPDPRGAARTALSAVSCTGPSSCTAVGDSNGVTLAEAWRGGQRWTFEPGPAVNGSLNSVSCVTARSCITVGSSNGAALAEAWNGTAWTTVTVPEPAGAANVNLNSVSCPAANSCTAVGTYADSTGSEQILAEAWNGNTWSIESTSSPAGGTGIGLFSVSCSASAACVAVGDYHDPTLGEQTLAESWNGSAWTIDPTVSPTNFSSLSSVSCVSATACTATGNASGSTLAEAWNGSTWTVQPTPTPAGAIGGAAIIAGVSCTCAIACTAFGYYYDDGQQGTNFDFADRWNGSTWRLQTVPTPRDVGYPGVWPAGLSCTSASNCVAVGRYYTTAPAVVALALTER